MVKKLVSMFVLFALLLGALSASAQEGGPEVPEGIITPAAGTCVAGSEFVLPSNTQLYQSDMATPMGVVSGGGWFIIYQCEEGQASVLYNGLEYWFFLPDAEAAAELAAMPEPSIPGSTIEGLRLIGSPREVPHGMSVESMYVGPWDASSNWGNVPAGIVNPVEALSYLLPGETLYVADTDDIVHAYVCNEDGLLGTVDGDDNNATVMILPPGVSEVTCVMALNRYEMDRRPGNSVAVHTFNKLEQGDVYAVSTDLTRQGNHFNGLFSGTATENGLVWGCDGVTIWRDGYTPNILTVTFRVNPSEEPQFWGFLTFQNQEDVFNPANTPNSPGGGTCPYLQISGVIDATSQFQPGVAPAA